MKLRMVEREEGKDEGWILMHLRKPEGALNG